MAMKGTIFMADQHPSDMIGGALAVVSFLTDVGHSTNNEQEQNFISEQGSVGLALILQGVQNTLAGALEKM